jgi:hypothetical protein
VLIAVQLTADHWFYLYIVWFLPCLLAALATARPERPAPRRPEPGRVTRPRVVEPQRV